MRLFNKNFPKHLSKRAANPFTSSFVIPILQANVKYGCVYSFVDCPQQRKVQVPMVFVDFLSTTRVPAGINVYTRNFLIVISQEIPHSKGSILKTYHLRHA